MIVAVNGSSYNITTTWDEVLLEDSIKLHQLEIPDVLLKMFIGKEKDLTDEQQIKELPEYFGKVLGILSDIPEKVISKIQWQDRTSFFNQYLVNVVIGIHFEQYPKTNGIKDFDFKGKKYYLPEKKVVSGMEFPLFDLDTLSFAEASDFEVTSRKMSKGFYDAAPQVIAILCKEKGEVYNEDKNIKKANAFKKLPMTIVWEVFFCIIQPSNTLKVGINSYSNRIKKGSGLQKK